MIGTIFDTDFLLQLQHFSSSLFRFRPKAATVTQQQQTFQQMKCQYQVPVSYPWIEVVIRLILGWKAAESPPIECIFSTNQFSKNLEFSSLTRSFSVDLKPKQRISFEKQGGGVKRDGGVGGGGSLACTASSFSISSSKRGLLSIARAVPYD